MKRTYIYRSPICGFTLLADVNMKKKTIRNKRVFVDYDHGTSGYTKYQFEMWCDSIAEELYDEGLLGP